MGFIVTNLETDSQAVVRFYNKRGTADRSAAGTGGLTEPQIGGDSVMKQAGEGKVCEESAEKRAVPSFGSYRKGQNGLFWVPRGAAWSEEWAGGSHAEVVRCMLMVSRVPK